VKGLRRMLVTAVVASLVGVTTGVASAQVTTGDVFDWSGHLPAGAVLRIYSVDGAITVSRASGDQVKVHGQRQVTRDSWHRDRQSSSRTLAFERIQDGDNVTICAYEQDRGSCSTGGVHGHSQHDSWESSPSADFTVQVPEGIKLAVGTGDGDVGVRGAGSEVSVSTGDGDITIDETTGPVRASSGDGKVYVSAVTGPVDASTGDGSIEVHMTSMPHPQDMHFSTGDGSVTIYLPASFSGELDVNTGDGQVESDFPLEIRGRLHAPHVHALIGGGGPSRLNVSTGDGDVRVRKEGA
jgi:hypothetical protein